MISKLQRQLRDTKILVHLFVCALGIASWADINSMWSELPLLVVKAPEEWTLPSYIIIISQVANVGPLLFVLITFLFPRTKGRIEVYASGGVVLLSVLSSFLLIFFWDRTSYVGGHQRSTGLLTLNFFMAFGDCVSSVAFYAYMAMLKPEYMATLLIGEGLSGLLPAMIALGQGVGDITCVDVKGTTNATFPNGTEYNKTTWEIQPEFGSPKFSVEVYFIIISSILAFCLVSFMLLNLLPYCRTEFIGPSGSNSDHEEIVPAEKKAFEYSSSSFDNPAFNGNEGIPRKSDEYSAVSVSEKKEKQRGLEISCTFLSLQAIIVLINMTLTTFLPTIQDYSTLPYGLRPYHLATTLSQIANPVACLFLQFIAAKGLLSISIVTLLGEAGAAYIIYLAAMSPDPPLHGETSGGNVAVAAWVIVTLLLVYAKICVAAVMRGHGRPYLIATGVSTQVGSLIGAIVGFFLVNQAEVFQKAPYC